MGLGSEPLGTVPLGLESEYLTEIVPIRQPTALRIDGTTKDFIQSADGQMEFAHPIDQMMFNLCRIATGSVRSSTATGNNISNSRYIDRVTIQQTIDTEIARRVMHLTSTGEVTLLGNEVDSSVRGRVVFRVNYKNNITGKAGKVYA
jgi:hypothetical protein